MEPDPRVGRVSRFLSGLVLLVLLPAGALWLFVELELIGFGYPGNVSARLGLVHDARLEVERNHELDRARAWDEFESWLTADPARRRDGGGRPWQTIDWPEAQTRVLYSLGGRNEWLIGPFLDPGPAGVCGLVFTPEGYDHLEPEDVYALLEPGASAPAFRFEW